MIAADKIDKAKNDKYRKALYDKGNFGKAIPLFTFIEVFYKTRFEKRVSGH